ncbi:MAG: RnfABCDGE type electron transport complex subunit D [Rhizomicrobium sp.]
MIRFRRIPTYRLALYYLGAIVVAALLLSLLGQVHQEPANLVFSALVLLAACFGANWVFARIFGAQSKWESVGISAVILALIITPVAGNDISGVGFLILAAACAMASKYLLALGRRHIFNPAAFGVALAGTGLNRAVNWWVGDNTILLPVILAGGLLILSRLRSYEMVASFMAVVLSIAVVEGGGASPGLSLSMMSMHSMFFFFAIVMLTEPRTAPIGRVPQIVYGALVGLCFAPTTHIGAYYFTPEVALLAGNLFAFLTRCRCLKHWADVLARKRTANI